MNFKKTGTLLLIMTVLLIASAGGVLRAEDNAKTQGTPCPKKVSVELEMAKTGSFMEYQYFAGQGHAEIVAVKSPVGGMLSEVKVSEGSLVDAGQDLAVMNAGMSNKIKELEAAAAKAKKILATRQGWKEKSEKAIQSAEKEYQKALDRLNNAKTQAGLVIKATVAGIVHLAAAAGSEIAADTLLLEITNPLNLILQAPLAAADKGSVAVGDKFIGTTKGFRGEVTAEVVAVSGDRVAFKVNNSGSQFREGAGFTFKKLKAEHAEALVIPSIAVQKDSLGEFIYLAEEKKARKMYVTLGASSEGNTMVEKGLGVGTPFIVSGFDCLADGKTIRVVNKQELAKETAEVEAKLKEKEATAPKAETPVLTEKPAVTKANRFRVGLTFARFSVNDKNLRAFYSDWFKNLPGIEVSVHTLYNIDIWASYKIFNEERTTTYYANPVKFKLVPLSVGLRYRFPKWRFLEPFVGAGLNFYSYKETIEGESPLEDTNGSASGFHFQGGTYLHMKHFRNFQGEVFFKYNMVKKTLAELLPDGTDQLDLGGLEAGIGIVVRF